MPGAEYESARTTDSKGFAALPSARHAISAAASRPRLGSRPAADSSWARVGWVVSDHSYETAAVRRHATADRRCDSRRPTSDVGST
ncbi:hypothetical protein DFJ68_2280 [Terracoccus luteus]|uniref:Uncharacterized protein n=1 Tax=Terracoccus luteus TaxID=53356 RepID=A0A495XX27_9MICO|nr:hypothetical protein DFJ68_2280 [Terracoccus luteus]